MEQFIGEIRMFGGNFAPNGWFLCHGQLLPIHAYTALFSILGTTYGGNGVNTFGLPDLQGRVPVGAGKSAFGTFYDLGQTGGAESIWLTQAQLPSHTHTLLASSEAADQTVPSGNALGSAAIYSAKAPDAPLNASSIGVSGVGRPFDNRQPFVVVNFIIAYQGFFPTRG